MRPANVHISHLPVDEIWDKVSEQFHMDGEIVATLNAEEIEKSHKLVSTFQFPLACLLFLELANDCQFQKRNMEL